MGKFKEDLNELQIRFLKTCQHKVFQSSFLVICYIGCNAWETLFVFKTKSWEFVICQLYLHLG